MLTRCLDGITFVGPDSESCFVVHKVLGATGYGMHIYMDIYSMLHAPYTFNEYTCTMLIRYTKYNMALCVMGVDN